MAIYMWREYTPPEYLCFTANTANSTVQLNKNSTPAAVTLETSTDGINWSTYTFGNTITLSNIGDKVYWRNTSETRTSFSTASTRYYQFAMTGQIYVSGDICYLLCKNNTDTITVNYTFYNLFRDCTALYSLPKLKPLSIPNYGYENMFRGCSNIKLSTTQTGGYQTPYRIPREGAGTRGTDSLAYMFTSTGGTFKSTPSINTTYYTSNTVI